MIADEITQQKEAMLKGNEYPNQRKDNMENRRERMIGWRPITVMDRDNAVMTMEGKITENTTNVKGFTSLLTDSLEGIMK